MLDGEKSQTLPLNWGKKRMPGIFFLLVHIVLECPSNIIVHKVDTRDMISGGRDEIRLFLGNIEISRKPKRII